MSVKRLSCLCKHAKTWVASRQRRICGQVRFPALDLQALALASSLPKAVPFKYGTYNRLGHWMLQPYYDEGRVCRWFHGTCAPIKWMWWRVVELMFRGQFQISGNMMPPDGIHTDLFSAGQILDYEFRDMLKAGKVKTFLDPSTFCRRRCDSHKWNEVGCQMW